MSRGWKTPPLLILPILAASALAADERWSAHVQATTVTQAHPGFRSAYQGRNSLSADSELETSLTATLFLGARLWPGGEMFVNPEPSGGRGLSGTRGVAGFPNAEIYRVDTPALRVNLSRLFLRQTFGFGGGREVVESGSNVLAGTVDRSRLTLVGGKFSLNDFFDANAYSHDPRTQFLNWCLMDNGAWDYAADTRDYTWGLYAELHQPAWSLRLATVMVPREANMLDLDPDFPAARGDNAEVEYRYGIRGHPGTVRLLGYLNHARMGDYRSTLKIPGFGMDVTQSRRASQKVGVGLNAEQEITRTLGGFVRLGWNDGATETWAFTEVDRTFSLGANLKGPLWGRPGDRAGLALILNELSGDHADYLAAGGYGFIVGDGRLTYAQEQIVEAYYLYKPLPFLGITGDVQWVTHPAYNRDRGPVTVATVRLHVEV